MNGNGRRESNALQVDVDDDYVSNYSNIQVVSTYFFFWFCITTDEQAIERFCTYQRHSVKWGLETEVILGVDEIYSYEKNKSEEVTFLQKPFSLMVMISLTKNYLDFSCKKSFNFILAHIPM